MTGRLDEIEARVNAASPAPWPYAETLWAGRAVDAEFIAAAREDIPWLIERLRDSQAEIHDIQRKCVSETALAYHDRDEARAEIERLHAVDFVHQGCAELRRKDNEYLIGKRDSLRAELADARAEIERLTIRVETQERLYDELRDELAAERAKVAAGIETEKSSNATARKIITDLRAKLAAVEQEPDEPCHELWAAARAALRRGDDR